MILHDIIRRPVITEKTSIQKEDYNQVTFEVDRGANRVEIKRAIETIFNVRVDSVKTMHVRARSSGGDVFWANAATGKRPSSN